MNWLRTAVGDFRSTRKCFSFAGSLLLIVLLLVSQTVCRPAEESFESFHVGDEYDDVDNVEWHHVQIDDDGIYREDHPVIMYKEDFVNEDYDANKSGKKLNNAQQRHHKTNHTAAEQYRAIKPEKIYFDVLPQTPIVVSDESGANDSKFDASKMRVDIISLVDDGSKESKDREEPSKQLFDKRPKKYHARIRRDISEHRVYKRNPYYRVNGKENANTLNSLLKYLNQVLPSPANAAFRSHPVPGKLWNSINIPVSPPEEPEQPMLFEDRFGDEDETDRVVWPNSNRRTTTRRPAPTRRTPSPLFHDSNPAHADLSFITRRPQANVQATTYRPLFTRRPTFSAATEASPVFAPELPEQPSRQQQPAQRRPTRRPVSSSAASASATTAAITAEPEKPLVSQCVWAIVNCCSTSNNNIRYNCFEQHGCHGAFWDLNPCADSVKYNVISQVSDMFD